MTCGYGWFGENLEYLVSNLKPYKLREFIKVNILSKWTWNHDLKFPIGTYVRIRSRGARVRFNIIA